MNLIDAFAANTLDAEEIDRGFVQAILIAGVVFIIGVFLLAHHLIQMKNRTLPYSARRLKAQKIFWIALPFMLVAIAILKQL